MRLSRNLHLVLAALALLVVALVLLLRPKSDDAKMLQSSTAGTQPPAAGQSPAASDQPSRSSPREADRLLKAEGARTDVTLANFPLKEYQHLPSPAGKAQGAPVGEAYIHVPSARRRIAMEPNQIGEFPAVETKLNDTVGVRLSLDAVTPDTPVRIVILDGGSFPATQGVTHVLKATSWGGVAFEYATSGNIGYHRILVQAQGQPSRILNFSAHDDDTWPAPSTASTD